MLNRLSLFMCRNYSPCLLLALFVPVIGLFLLFNFSNSPIPISNPQLVSISGGEGLLDLKFFYTAQEAYASLTKYGEAGRSLYKNFLAADFIFALCYGIGFSLLFTRLLKALDQSESGWMKFNLLPLAIALADYTENILIYSMLHVYPQPVPVLGTLAGIATLGKQLLVFASLAFLLAGTIVLIMRKIKAR